MPPIAYRPAALGADPFRGSIAVAEGLLTRRQLAGSSWRRLFHDVYVHHDVPLTHALRARGAATLLPDAVITGPSAAVLWGVELAGPTDPVEVTRPPRSHMVRVEGLVARRAALAGTHVARRRGVRLSTPAATAVRLAAALTIDAAVAAVDQLIHAGVVDLATVRSLAGMSRGPGSARAREVAALADGLAESPQETRLRLIIGRSRLPTPVPQYEVRHDGRFVARTDFAWPEHKVAVEYDGLWHAEPGQFAKDRRRLNRLQAAGWRVVFVTAADLHDAIGLIARLAAALYG